MAIPNQNGIFDVANSKIVASSTGTWDQLGAGDSAGENAIQTWDEWLSWNFVPNTTVTWASEAIDFGTASWVTANITIDCSGSPTYTIYASTTGEFAGEETSVTFTEGDEDIAAVYGRYIILYISVEYVPSEGVAEIRSFTWSASGARTNAFEYDLNSADLGGVQTARELVPPRKFSKLLTMRITPISSNYVADNYVANGYVVDPIAPYPYIVDKDRATPKIAFVDTAGSSADTQFDIEYIGLPEMYMDGRDLRTR